MRHPGINGLMGPGPSAELRLSGELWQAVTRRSSSLVEESLALRRLSSDAPEAPLAHQHKRFSVNGAFG